MWIATEHGFYSAVQNRNNHNTVLIRARVRKDLEYLRERLGAFNCPPIVDSPKADYPHRLLITKEQWAWFLARSGEEVDYPNFKSRVGKHDPAREKIYHEVWADLMKLEPGYKKHWNDRWLYEGTGLTQDQRDALDARWDDPEEYEPFHCPKCELLITDFEQEQCPDCGEELWSYEDETALDDDDVFVNQLFPKGA